MRRTGIISATGMLTLVMTLGLLGAAPVAGAPNEDWPMFGHDPRHTGTTTDSGLGAGNVGSLNLQWQTNLGQAISASPAVVHNTATGRQLVYLADSSGTVTAVDGHNGERVWSYRAAANINSSPAVFGGVVYIGSSDHKLYALNATTGARLCSFDTGGVISSSPAAVATAHGVVVYVGDNGIGGSNDGGHVWAINGVDPNAAGDCTLKWSFENFGDPPGSQPNAGMWSPPAYATDRNGRALVIAGSSSPDNAAYAFDALTGQVVWRFQTQFFFADGDVGAGPTISPPGVNGFADGVAYVIPKTGILYALNLTTGAKLWEFSIRADAPVSNGPTRSTPALVDDRLYLGYGSGVYGINAVTGAKVWRTQSDTAVEVTSSPAVTGSAGDRTLLVGDVSGKLYALRAADGAKLWSYATGGLVYSSLAVSGGKAFAGSTDNFLYAFGLGGGTSARPVATITSPANNATVPNPGGDQPMSGSATDDNGVDRVLVSVKDRNTSKWWDGTTRTWTKYFADNRATLANPGGAATGWTFSFPAPAAGASYLAYADAVDGDGQHSAPVAESRFVVASSGAPPDTTITSPRRKQVFNLPSPPATFPVTAQGTATDSGGANPGIAQVTVVIRNIEHGEYYCGPNGCPGTPGVPWRTQYTTLQATLAQPNANSTAWSLTFSVMDHAHKYSISAWATDRDGEVDPTKVRVSPICVRDPGVRSCI
jgi:outer membrane protein assembly factor BamB